MQQLALSLIIKQLLCQVGEILFVERPYCSVLLPEQYASHCHHCHVPVEVPVPCLECTQPRYCSDECRQSSWDGYHRFECGGLDLLNSVGVAHLALRAVLTCGVDKLREIRPFVDKKTATLPKGSDISGKTRY